MTVRSDLSHRKTSFFPLFTMLNGRLSLCLVLSTLLSSSVIYGDTLPDDLPDFDESFDVFSDIELSESATSTDLSSTNSLIQWPVYSLRYQVGVNANDINSVNTHRLDLRVQHEKYWGNQWFSRIDVKGILRDLDSMDIPPTRDDRQLTFDAPIREAFIQKSYEQWTWTMGYQKVVWSEFDTVEINDVIAAKDFTEFAFTAPEDARLGQPMIKSQLYIDRPSFKGQWEWLVNLAPEVNQYPGGEADGLLNLTLQGQNFSLDEDKPNAFEDLEFATRWYQSQDKMDFSVLWASLLQNTPTFRLAAPTPSLLPNAPPPSLDFSAQYDRFHLLGISANYSLGQLLWKSEIAYKKGIQLNNSSEDELDIIELGLGFDFDANGAYNGTIELLQQQLSANDNAALAYSELTQMNGRWSRTFFHEDLEVTYFFSYQWQYRDQVHSAFIEYQWDDNLSLSFSGTFFKAGEEDSPGQVTDERDQWVWVIQYSF